MYPIIATKTSKSTTEEANKLVCVSVSNSVDIIIMYNNRIDENITMKECQSYGLHKLNKAVIYEECDDKLPVVDESTDDKPVKPVVDEPPAAAAPPVVYEAFATDDVIHHVDDINIYET